MRESNFFVKRMQEAQDLPVPFRATADSAGLDLYANVREELCIAPGARALIPCGISLALPRGYEAQIRARSGLAVKHGIGVLNAPATIDADYRGEVKVILINWGEAPFPIRRGDRIAQLVLCAVCMADLTEVDVLPDTVRGEGGFGSTGK